jgi:hypothetical protein
MNPPDFFIDLALCFRRASRVRTRGNDSTQQAGPLAARFGTRLFLKAQYTIIG